MKKIFLAFAAVAVLSLSLLAGCGGDSWLTTGSDGETVLQKGYYTYETYVSSYGHVTGVVEINWKDRDGLYFRSFYDENGEPIHLTYGTNPAAVEGSGEYSVQENETIRFHEIAGVGFAGYSTSSQSFYWVQNGDGGYMTEDENEAIVKMPAGWSPSELAS